MGDQAGADQVHPEAAASGQGSWTWSEPRPGEHFRTCSWCGSIHPEDLAVETGWVPEWADMKYGFPHKFWVDVTNRDPDRLYVLGAAYGPQPSTFVPWTPVGELTAAQRETVEREGYRDADMPDFLNFGTRPAHHAKFYTVHLRDTTAAAKAAIEQRSGVAFDFTRDWWGPAVPAEPFGPPAPPPV